jgi:hypothetical protein
VFSFFLSLFLIQYLWIARGAGSVKADQWRSQLNILFAGLFVAWEINGEIPGEDAPLSAPNTKNATAQAGLEKLVQDRLVTNLLAKNPNATDAEVA